MITRRKIFLCILFIIVTYNTSIIRGESTILGAIDIPKQDSTINTMTDDFSLEGWALSADGISKIEVIFDNKIIGHASYSLLREDVYNAYPKIEGSKNSGFKYIFEKELLTEGVHVISVAITSKAGETHMLGPININISGGNFGDKSSVKTDNLKVSNNQIVKYLIYIITLVILLFLNFRIFRKEKIL